MCAIPPAVGPAVRRAPLTLLERSAWRATCLRSDTFLGRFLGFASLDSHVAPLVVGQRPFSSRSAQSTLRSDAKEKNVKMVENDARM